MRGPVVAQIQRNYNVGAADSTDLLNPLTIKFIHPINLSPLYIIYIYHLISLLYLIIY